MRNMARSMSVQEIDKVANFYARRPKGEGG
jgi:hypothetical protein